MFFKKLTTSGKILKIAEVIVNHFDGIPKQSLRWNKEFNVNKFYWLGIKCQTDLVNIIKNFPEEFKLFGIRVTRETHNAGKFGEPKIYNRLEYVQGTGHPNDIVVTDFWIKEEF